MVTSRSAFRLMPLILYFLSEPEHGSHWSIYVLSIMLSRNYTLERIWKVIKTRKDFIRNIIYIRKNKIDDGGDKCQEKK